MRDCESERVRMRERERERERESTHEAAALETLLTQALAHWKDNAQWQTKNNIVRSKPTN